MSTEPTFADVAAQHQCAISDDFLTHDVHAECSCGWIGTNVYATGPSRIRTAEALADHAAHVHVAAGLAEEDE